MARVKNDDGSWEHAESTLPPQRKMAGLLGCSSIALGSSTRGPSYHVIDRNLKRRMKTLAALSLVWILLCCCYVQSECMKLEGAKPDCQSTCGNVDIPYPFGIGEGCFLDGFGIACNKSFEPPIPLLLDELPVIEISQGLVLINVTNHLTYSCYDRSGQSIGTDGWFNLTDSLFTFSHTRNKFTVIGCDTVAFFADSDNSITGCVSICGGSDKVKSGRCSGFGCCAVDIPSGLQYFGASISSINNYNKTWNYSSCGYAYLLDQDHFKFSRSDLQHFLNRTDLSVSLDWRIGKETCAEAKMDSTSFACKANNSECVTPNEGSGYLCNCSKGYSGNPYMVNGCKNINECLVDNPCVKEAKCVDSEGSYRCECQHGTQGNGTKEGTGCIKKIDQFPLIKAILVSGLVLLFLLGSTSWAYWAIKKRELMKLREKFFEQNGGLLLQQKTPSLGGTASVRIFTPEELKEATDNYAKSRILGTGGFGTIYRGILKDRRIVAIKKSKAVNEAQIEQFINEVIILSQINHRNVVKLLGCCFETRIPILVYEFVSNGTLSDRIHDSSGTVSRISWDTRMRIATETAEALAYLHSAASVPIFHMDIKPVNILLDEHYTAKVADFGASRLVSLDDESNKIDYIQGTLGYLDPEYLQTYCSTEKSDVYSFGVVLAELLTGRKKPTIDFLSAMKQNRLVEILEAGVLEEGTLQELQAVADLAKRCLRLKGEERPTMKEVAQELGWIKGTERRPWSMQQNQEETRHLFGDFKPS